MPPLDPRSSILDSPIGLLGGSFDPIHVGHLQLARAARDRLGLAEVRLIPAAQPWQKGPITDAAQRARMVALAIAEEPRLVLDMIEIERGGPNYTIDTLRALRAALGPEQPLVLLIGADQMARLDSWREWQSLLDYAHIAVARRNGPPALGAALRAYFDAHRAGTEALSSAPAGAIVDLPMTAVDASATEIRALVSEPPSPARAARLAALVPAPVLLYIRRQGLYAPHTPLATREKEKIRTMDLQKLQRLVVDALEDVKAQDIQVFNTVGQSDMFDRVVLASGSSNRQTRALAWSVVEKVKQAGGQVVSVEGTDPGEWVLVDLGDVIVHIMQPAIRQYYGLEEVWGTRPVRIRLASDVLAQRRARSLAAAAAESAGALDKQVRATPRKSSPPPVARTPAGSIAKSAARSAVKSAAKAAAKTAHRSAAKSTPKTAPRSAAKSTAKSSPRPAAKSAARKSAKATRKPARRSAATWVAKSAARSPVTKSARRPATGASKRAPVAGKTAAPKKAAPRARKTTRGRASRA